MNRRKYASKRGMGLGISDTTTKGNLFIKGKIYKGQQSYIQNKLQSTTEKYEYYALQHATAEQQGCSWPQRRRECAAAAGTAAAAAAPRARDDAGDGARATAHPAPEARR